MKFKQFQPLFLIIAFVGTAISFKNFAPKRGDEPWTATQLLAPGDLAMTITDPKAKQPILFSVGPGALIKGSIDIGPASASANLAKFRQRLDHWAKDANIVIYCGCCPFEHCPNIRPAFSLLNQMNFTHQKLLNLEHNIKIDWINKGYPVIP